MLGSMSQRLRMQLREIDELSLHSATCRVAAYLLKQAPADSDIFELPVAKGGGLTPVGPSPRRSPGSSRSGDDRVIQIAGSRVTILDRAALDVVAETCAAVRDDY